MELFDYGIMGEKAMGTDFWCYIKLIRDDDVVVVTEDCEEITVECPRFEKHGNIMRRLGLEPEESQLSVGRVIASLGLTSDEFYSEGLKRFRREYELEAKEGSGKEREEVKVASPKAKPKAKNDAEDSVPVCIPDKDLMHNCFVRLVRQDKTGEKSSGSFSVGVCYPILYGCLLDDDNYCAYDVIHSIDDINKWDCGHRVWEAWDERKPSCFME